MKTFGSNHLLIDTNLLIKISRYSNTTFFDSFLDELEKLQIRSVIEESTLFEFTRGSRTKSQLNAKNAFLEALLGGRHNKLILPGSNSKEILNNAQELAVLYSHKNINLSKQISFTDCLVGAQLMKYKNGLCLATIDNNDYPLFIFNRNDLVTIDTEKEIINIGIYTFNEGKYKKCKENFEKT